MEEVIPVSIPPAPPASSEDHKKRMKKIWLLISFFVLIGLAFLIYWVIWGRFIEYTNDAYVNGNMVMVTPQIPGIVTSINTDNTDFVDTGRLLVELDKTDSIIALAISKAKLGSALREVVGMFEKVAELESLQEVRTAQLVKTLQDFEHRKELVEAGGVSLEDFEHAQDDLMAAYGSLNVVKHQLQNAFAQIENTTIVDHPMVEAAKNELRDNWVRLQRCEIAAPASGLVAQRKVQVGKWVNPAEALLAVIPLDQMWVDANFKEVQLTYMRIGQKAEVRSDIYGRKVTYRGTVVGIGGGTGSVFSVLPPQNATGNWIKIVQRIPVRIALDPQQVKKFPLRLGLSMEVRVDIHNTQGPMVPQKKPAGPVYKTDIFANQEAGAEEVIDEIVQNNVDPAYFQTEIEPSLPNGETEE